MNRTVTGTPGARPLTQVLAKSKPVKDPERLTSHSLTVYETVSQVEARIGRTGLLAAEPDFWSRVRRAALLHDTGKIAEGFQRQVRPGGAVWGERHEVLSLAYVDLLATAGRWPHHDHLMIATLVATHHRPLFSGAAPRGKPSLDALYTSATRWDEAFTRTPDPNGGSTVQVQRGTHRELLAWFAGMLRLDPPVPARDDPTLAQRARLSLARLFVAWERPVAPERGLLAVLAQGAVTLADRAGSAHVALQTHLPLTADYLARLSHTPYPHQRQAAATDGHLLLVAPTGSGKTEAGLAWAASQLAHLPGLPRVVWTLPYRASLNAARQRLRATLTPAPGQQQPDIGLLHGTVAHTLLTEATQDDCAPTQAHATKARQQAGAMRLFAQRLRVATPHQLLNGAIAGPAYSSVLLEQANSLFVLDELHAYEPQTFGRICAAMRLWEHLGSRTAVLSATLAPPMIDIIRESLTQPVTLHRAPPGTSPVRHQLALDDEPITEPAGIARLRGWLTEGHSVLVIVNRVATAQHLYALLADDARKALPDDPDAALLLHSRFRNRDRAAIETRLLKRHPERAVGERAARGGLVVATQAVEVSLQLDFDRGAVECAPIEAVAQRAGRVNRRGRHPDGAVEFRVHRAETERPYAKGAMDASWRALTRHVETGSAALSEETIDTLLADAYDTPWGRAWAEEARRARDEFTETFLTFTDPFHDRGEFAHRLSEQFDSVEAVHEDDAPEFHTLVKGPDGDPLLASGLLIPLRYTQLPAYRARYDRTLHVHVIEGRYNETLGLRPPEEPETVL